MISIHNKILSNEEVKILLDYFQKDDEKVDARPDVRSKHPIWEETDWPEYIIQNALTRILNYDYKVEEVVFFESKISYSLHVDSGKCPKSRTGNVVIFPLTVEGLGTTALFNNFCCWTICRSKWWYCNSIYGWSSRCFRSCYGGNCGSSKCNRSWYSSCCPTTNI